MKKILADIPFYVILLLIITYLSTTALVDKIKEKISNYFKKGAEP